MPLFNAEQLGIFLDRSNPDQQVLCADLYWRPQGGGGGGTVTSVGLGAPAEFNVSGSPVTTTGTLSFAWANQAQNLVLASPVGSTGTPAFRAIDPTDLAGTPGAGKYWDGTGTWTTLPAPGTGTVTSVDVTGASPLFTSAGGPITTSGTITLALSTQTANSIFAGPASGGAATPTFRSIVTADLGTGTANASKYLAGDLTWKTTPLGSVTSVGLTSSGPFIISNSPITTSGDIDLEFAFVAPNRFLGGAPSGVVAIQPTFRLLVAADLPAGTGTVTSVALTAPAEITVGGSPITTSGTIALSWTNESANKVFAGPTSGGAATPAFRSLVAADIPSLSYVTSVALAAPAEFNVSGSPVTTSGTLTLAWANESANVVFAGPATGAAATPTFRALVTADLPAGTGTVTSVAVAVPAALLTVSGSPITTAGTITIALATQSANTLLAGPTSGGAVAPAFRTLVAEDIATGTATSGFLPASAGAGAKPAWTSVAGATIGNTSGPELSRPSASSGNLYTATDSHQQYISTNAPAWWVLGRGSDQAKLGGLAGGFTDNIYISAPASASAGPPMTNPYTFAILIDVLSLPGTGGGVVAQYLSGNITSGWYLANSQTNSNKLRMGLNNVTSNPTELTSLSALTTGRHCIVIAYNGTQFIYCMDGGTVNTASVSGSYVAPTSGALFQIGKFSGASGLASAWFDFIGFMSFASVLSNADIQTLSGSPSTYRFANISATPSYMMMAEWWPQGESSASVAQQIWGSARSLNSIMGPNGAIYKTEI